MPPALFAITNGVSYGCHSLVARVTRVSPGSRGLDLHDQRATAVADIGCACRRGGRQPWLTRLDLAPVLASAVADIDQICEPSRRRPGLTSMEQAPVQASARADAL